MAYRKRTVEEWTKLVQTQYVDNDYDDGQYESGSHYKVVEAVHAEIPAVAAFVHADDATYSNNL